MNRFRNWHNSIETKSRNCMESGSYGIFYASGHPARRVGEEESFLLDCFREDAIDNLVVCVYNNKMQMICVFGFMYSCTHSKNVSKG